MELPKTPVEYAMWMGMQFPMVGVAALAVYSVLRLVDRWADENRRLYADRLADKDREIKQRDARIRRLERELAETRDELFRSIKPENES